MRTHTRLEKVAEALGTLLASALLLGVAYGFTVLLWALSPAEAQEYDAADSYEAIYSVDGDEIIETPDGPCQRLYWSTYLGKCTKPLEMVTVPETEFFHPVEGTFKDHYEASKACHAINSWLLESYLWFQEQLGSEHGLTQLYKYSLEASLKGCAG